MGRTKSLDVIRRDILIREAIAQGKPRQEIAEEHGISLARVSQINSEQYDSLSDDETRDVLRAQHEYIIRKNLETIASPPQKVSPSGRLIYKPLLDEDGNPVIAESGHGRGNPLNDISQPVEDRDAIATASKAAQASMESIAKLLGINIIKPKIVDESKIYLETMQWATEQATRAKEQELVIEELKAQLGIEDLDAEEVREIEASETSAP
jgi:hypothetical protein